MSDIFTVAVVGGGIGRSHIIEGYLPNADKFKVLFRQNQPGRRYDPNWFSYGPDGKLNNDNPNTGGDVKTGYDVP